MTTDQPTTTAPRSCPRFDLLSWVLGYATGLLLGTLIAAWAFIFTVH